LAVLDIAVKVTFGEVKRELATLLFGEVVEADAIGVFVLFDFSPPDDGAFEGEGLFVGMGFADLDGDGHLQWEKMVRDDTQSPHGYVFCKGMFLSGLCSLVVGEPYLPLAGVSMMLPTIPWGEKHAVLAFVFGLVKSPVSLGEEIRYGSPRVRKGGDAPAEMDAIFGEEGVIMEASYQSVGKIQRTVSICFGQEDEKLFAAVSAEHVLKPDVGSDKCGESPEDFVTKEVSPGIIDAFKVVEIQDDEGELLLVPQAAIEFFLEAGLHVATIKGPCEAIHHSHFFGLFEEVKLNNHGVGDQPVVVDKIVDDGETKSHRSLELVGKKFRVFDDPYPVGSGFLFGKIVVNKKGEKGGEKGLLLVLVFLKFLDCREKIGKIDFLLLFEEGDDAFQKKGILFIHTYPLWRVSFLIIGGNTMRLRRKVSGWGEVTLHHILRDRSLLADLLVETGRGSPCALLGGIVVGKETKCR